MYKVIERKDPRNPEGQGKYYGLIVNMSNIGIDELATRISATCTVTRHDCLAVLSALQEQIIYALKEGRRVHLGDIGSFRVVANGTGSATPETYDTSFMQKLHVRLTFFPSRFSLRSRLSFPRLPFPRVCNPRVLNMRIFNPRKTYSYFVGRLRNAQGRSSKRYFFNGSGDPDI